MRDFVTSNLRINEGAFVPLGAKEIPSANTLYYSYINFCKKTGYEACSHIKFSRNLLDTLRMLHIPSSKKRREGGQSIIGVSLKEGKEIKSTDQSFLESLREKTKNKKEKIFF